MEDGAPDVPAYMVDGALDVPIKMVAVYHRLDSERSMHRKWKSSN